MSPEQRKTVHAAFSDLDRDTDITESGLLKFSTINHYAKQNSELKKVIDDLLKEKGTMTLVKCSLQASLASKTKKISRETQIKKECESVKEEVKKEEFTKEEVMKNEVTTAHPASIILAFCEEGGCVLKHSIFPHTP